MDSYESLKAFYDETLNKDKSLFKTSNDEPTPISCIEEMISKIPESFWMNEHVRILDPCCGCGNFFIVILSKLLKYHSIHHILENMLYFNDLNLTRIDIVKKIFSAETFRLNITTHDFTTFENPEKFDLIVANPPYAHILESGKRASKNHNLIGVFIQKSLTLLKPGGLLLFITPDNWMSFADRNILITQLTSLQIHYLNIHQAKRYFPKVGSSFTWYLVENTPAYKDIEIEGIFQGRHYRDTVRSEIRRFIPLYYTRMIQDILHKTVDLPNQKFQVETSSDLHKYTKRDLISNTQSTEYCYKLIHTPTQTVWASRPHKYQSGFKVFISTTSYYGTFVDECGMTQSIAFIRCESREHAENLSRVLQHPLYKFLNNICRYGNFNNIRVLQQFPYCESVEDVYVKNGITDEEIRFIEESS